METNRRILMWVSLIPADKGISSIRKFASKLLCLSIFATVLSVSISSWAFYFKFVSIDLQKSLYAFAQIAAFTSMTYAIIVTFFIRHRFPAIFESLNKICETSESALFVSFSNNPLFIFNLDKSKYFIELLAKANGTAAWMWEVYMKYVLHGTIVATLMQFFVLLSYCFIRNGHFDANYVYYPYTLV